MFQGTKGCVDDSSSAESSPKVVDEPLHDSDVVALKGKGKLDALLTAEAHTKLTEFDGDEIESSSAESSPKAMRAGAHSGRLGNDDVALKGKGKLPKARQRVKVKARMRVKVKAKGMRLVVWHRIVHPQAMRIF